MMRLFKWLFGAQLSAPRCEHSTTRDERWAHNTAELAAYDCHRCDAFAYESLGLVVTLRVLTMPQAEELLDLSADKDCPTCAVRNALAAELRARRPSRPLRLVKFGRN